MRTAFPVQELPVRSALTVAANCVNRTRKHAASVTAYSVLRACPSIQCSTRSLHQQTTGNVGNEKGLRASEQANCGKIRWQVNLNLKDENYGDLSILRSESRLVQRSTRRMYSES